MKGFNDKKEELTYILYADIAIKKAKLQATEKTYQDCVNKEKNFNYNENLIKNAAIFIKENGYTKKFLVPAITKNSKEKSDFTISMNIPIGNYISNDEEYILLVKYLIGVVRGLNKKDNSRNVVSLSNSEKKEYLVSKTTKITNELFELWSKAFLEFFMKCYKNFSKEIEKMVIYYELLEDYFENPTIDKYNDLMSKVVYIKKIRDPDFETEIKSLIKEYSSFIKKDKNSNQEEPLKLLKTREDRISNYKKNKASYVDLEEVKLTVEEENILNEIYEFVLSLDKDDLKEFTADPLSFFSHINFESKDKIINNFIKRLESDFNSKNKQTIIKRLKY